MGIVHNRRHASILAFFSSFHREEDVQLYANCYSCVTLSDNVAIHSMNLLKRHKPCSQLPDCVSFFPFRMLSVESVLRRTLVGLYTNPA